MIPLLSHAQLLYGMSSAAPEALSHAKRRTYKRDRRGRFASTGSPRVKRARRMINRRRARYVRSSLGKTVRVGRSALAVSTPGSHRCEATHPQASRRVVFARHGRLSVTREISAELHKCVVGRAGLEPATNGGRVLADSH